MCLSLRTTVQIVEGLRQNPKAYKYCQLLRTTVQIVEGLRQVGVVIEQIRS